MELIHRQKNFQNVYEKVKMIIETASGNNFPKPISSIKKNLIVNPFHATGLFLYTLKTPEKKKFSDVFWE